MYTFENLNQSIIGLSKGLLKVGKWRETRGFKCLEFPYPILIEITNPTDRYVIIPERKWNTLLPFVESLWLALGMNNLDELPGNYVKNLYSYSDDGHRWRAAYGSRLRSFNGSKNDYKCDIPFNKGVDQFKFVLESFKRDIQTRQAGITIHDVLKDDFDKKGNLKKTKDQPCTRTLQFQLNTEGELDLTVTMRSNDILFGYSAINVFNFTWIQEYFANMLGFEIGHYYHLANNFHVYDNYLEKVKTFASLNPNDYKSKHGVYQYSDKFKNLEEFDKLLLQLYHYEQGIRKAVHGDLVGFGNDMFDDWSKVFYNYHTNSNVEFKNPYLNDLFKKEIQA